MNEPRTERAPRAVDQATEWTARTRRLLTAAAWAGPFFVLSATVQSLTRTGFDLRVHPLSQLATGTFGWVQVATFVLTGLGMVALAVAHRRLVTVGVGRRAVPVLLTVFGGGLVLAGISPMDPQHGFPVGAPHGPVEMSWHGVVHSVAAAVSFSALAVACVVLVVRSVRGRRPAAALAHGVVAAALLVPVSPEHASVQVAVTGLVAYTWSTVVALHLRRRTVQTASLEGETR